ncbi:MAG TPA: hypothetical protein VNA12_07005 [Mycobacteriales bacterium]|nr:hypothetical protein [Mycobacteriales bacterium]
MSGQIGELTRALTRGRPRAALGLFVALSLLAGGWRVLSARGDLRDAEVVLRDAVDVTVSSGTTRRAGVPGESLPPGATVSTGAAGSATLDVRDRLVRLAAATAVGVPDGATVQLTRGSILVDRRNGPEVTVRAGLLVIDEVDSGGLRVDRGFSTRVSVYSGGARARTSDRRIDVPRLHGVGVAGRALPDRPAPLRLTGDLWEREIIPQVVAADVTLTRLAKGLDTARTVPAGAVEVLPAVYRDALASLPSNAGRSEALLPVAIGEAAGGAEEVVRSLDLRAAGASWGVVAALVGARSADVAAELSRLIRRADPSAGPGTVAAGDPTEAPDFGPEPGPTATPNRSGRPGQSPRPTPSRSSGPSPSSSPSPSEGVVETIRRLLPSGSPTPTPPALVPSPVGVGPLVLTRVVPA